MRSPMNMVARDKAIPDRPTPVETDREHYVKRRPLDGPVPPGFETAMFAMGCFWAPEPMFFNEPGVWVTAVGYSGGYTANPRYEDVCSGGTGHAEVVRIVYDPARISYERLLEIFWEGHNPTKGMKQARDEGTQYRSAIFYFTEAQRLLAEESRDAYQSDLSREGFGKITTDIAPAGPFYFAEGYHQAYFEKNPEQICDIEPTGVSCRFRSTRNGRSGG